MKRQAQYQSESRIPARAYGELTDASMDRLSRRKIGAIIGKRALAAAYGGEEETAATVTDLLADLRHFCDAAGLDFAELDHDAHGHYTHELFENE